MTVKATKAARPAFSVLPNTATNLRDGYVDVGAGWILHEHLGGREHKIDLIDTTLTSLRSMSWFGEAAWRGHEGPGCGHVLVEFKSMPWQAWLASTDGFYMLEAEVCEVQMMVSILQCALNGTRFDAMSLKLAEVNYKRRFTLARDRMDLLSRELSDAERTAARADLQIWENDLAMVNDAEPPPTVYWPMKAFPREGTNNAALAALSGKMFESLESVVDCLHSITSTLPPNIVPLLSAKERQDNTFRLFRSKARYPSVPGSLRFAHEVAAC